jgi:DNA repair photolyase
MRPPARGRGASTNRTGRFERFQVVPEDDGWTAGDPDVPPLVTTLTRDASRSIITRNDSPDVPFDRSINPYRGCEHGCIYCFARPTHAWLGLSPGLDFESRLFFKPEAASLLRSELRRPGYRCDVLAMGTNTDPYQPVERSLRITRAVLEVLADHRHPVTIVTKSHLVVRDLDLLSSLARDGLARVAVSITTLDRRLARLLEPRAPAPHRRLQAIGALAAAGVPAGIMAAPVIPGLTEPELESILGAASSAGAGHAGYVLLRLPLEVEPLFIEWLERHEPLKSRRILSALRDLRGGRLSTAAFGRRMRGDGPRADLLSRRFHLACRRLGLATDPAPLDRSRFRIPPAPGDQGSLFDPAPTSG